MVYTLLDRMVSGGAKPVCEVAKIEPVDEIKATFFLHRREPGIFNAGDPGYMATPPDGPAAQRGPSVKLIITGRTPAYRWGTPEDLQELVVFLASRASDFVNGNILYVDGGILAYSGEQL
ncbi:SDR family oxidoreductase [bacterium]|nr:SDR family oxidoreductase [bacterium]